MGGMDSIISLVATYFKIWVKEICIVEKTDCTEYLKNKLKKLAKIS